MQNWKLETVTQQVLGEGKLRPSVGLIYGYKYGYTEPRYEGRVMTPKVPSVVALLWLIHAPQRFCFIFLRAFLCK